MKKLLATLLASTMALSAMGALVACGGGDEGDNGNKGGQLTDYYLVGSSVGALFAGTAVDGWTPLGTAGGPESRDEIAEKLFFRTTGKAEVYTVTVDFYKGDTWCICDAKAGENALEDEGGSASGWDNQIKYAMSDAVYGSESEYIVKGVAENGGQCNFLVAKSGKYEITLELHGGEFEMPLVKYNRVGDAAKLEMEEKDVYIKGNLASLNAWDHGFSSDWLLAYDSDKDEYSCTLTVAAEDCAAGGGYEFGIEVCEQGATSGYGVFLSTGALGEDGDANDKFGSVGNFAPTTAGTYKIVVKFDGAWVVDFYAQA